MNLCFVLSGFNFPSVITGTKQKQPGDNLTLGEKNILNHTAPSFTTPKGTERN